MGEDAEGRPHEPAGSSWADLLDPVANSRALGEVQAQALRAAGDIVDRLVRVVDDRPAWEPSSDADRSADGRSGEAGRLIDAWVEVLARVGRAFATPRPGEGTSRVELDLADGGSAVVRITAGSGEPSAEVWLVNSGPEPLGPVTLVPAPLVAAGGTRYDSEPTVDPARIDELPARSSRGVVVSVGPPETAVPGTYRGLLQVAGAPAAFVVLEVLVTGDGSA